MPHLRVRHFLSYWSLRTSPQAGVAIPFEIRIVLVGWPDHRPPRGKAVPPNVILSEHSESKNPPDIWTSIRRATFVMRPCRSEWALPIPYKTGYDSVGNRHCLFRAAVRRQKASMGRGPQIDPHPSALAGCHLPQRGRLWRLCRRSWALPIPYRTMGIAIPPPPAPSGHPPHKCGGRDCGLVCNDRASNEITPGSEQLRGRSL